MKTKTVQYVRDPKEASLERYLEKKKDNPPKVSGDRDDAVVILARFTEATGSVSDDFRTCLFQQISDLLPTGANRDAFLNSALALLHGLQPRNEMEGLLGVQLFCTHVLAIQMMARAGTSENPKVTDANVNRADK